MLSILSIQRESILSILAEAACEAREGPETHIPRLCGQDVQGRGAKEKDTGHVRV